MRLYPPPVPHGLPATAYLRTLVDELQRALIPALVTTEAVPHIRLLSPDGSVWRIEVTNLGALTATKETGT